MFRSFSSFIVILTALISCIFSGCSADSGTSSQNSNNVLPIIVGDGSGNVEPGKDLELNWEITTDQPSTVLIEITYDGGKTWQVVESSITNTGTYNFSVVDVPGAEFRVRVVAPESNTVIAESETITTTGTTPKLAVNDGKLSFSPSEEINLSWTQSSSQPDPLALQISKDGGTTFTLLENIPNTGSYTLKSPSQPGTFILRIIDPKSGLIFAQTGNLLVVSGYPGMAITGGGGQARSQSYLVQATIEPLHRQILKDAQGRVKAQVNLIGVAE